MKVELIYEKSCPNITSAREQLIKAFHLANKQPSWCEWETSCIDTPDYARQLGSPSILIDGIDVSATDNVLSAQQCRLYKNSQHQLTGIPNLDDIVEALKLAKSNRTKLLSSSLFPVIGMAFLPKLVCPACWPAYAGLLSSFGISFLDYTPYLLPMTLFFVLIALGALLFKADIRHGYVPFIIGLFSSIILIMGKFQFNNDLSMYIGLGFLILVSLWNSWPINSSKDATKCSACTSYNYLDY